MIIDNRSGFPQGPGRSWALCNRAEDESKDADWPCAAVSITSGHMLVAIGVCSGAQALRLAYLAISQIPNLRSHTSRSRIPGHLDSRRLTTIWFCAVSTLVRRSEPINNRSSRAERIRGGRSYRTSDGSGSQGAHPALDGTQCFDLGAGRTLAWNPLVATTIANP